MAQMLTNPATLQTTFDSGSLTLNCSVTHPLKAAGSFVVFVWRGEVRVGAVAITVQKSGGSQVSLDLFAIERSAQGQPLNTAVESHALKEGGHMVLNVSDGTRGYFVTILDRSGQNTLWDSRTLSPGDIYSLLALTPGAYAATNVNTGARADMTVSYPQGPNERQTQTPIYVKATATALEPAQWSVSGVQPIVIAAETASRFTISLTKADGSTRTKDQILANERLRLRQAVAGRFGPKVQQV